MRTTQARQNEANQTAHDEKQARMGVESTPCPSIDHRVIVFVTVEN